MHGFGGYFDAVLYNDVMITIHPERMDPRQLSWFPAFFPLRVRAPSRSTELIAQDALYLPSGAELDVHIYRVTDTAKRRVWFEWSAESFLPIRGGQLAHLAPSPSTASAAATPGAAPSEVLSPVQNAQHPIGGRGGWTTPMSEEFSSAPSPRIVSGGSTAPDPFGAALGGAADATTRVRIGVTRLHNPAGRSSSVTL